VAPGLLACPGCAWLTHGDELTRLAEEAERAESAGDATTALATWRRTLELLPPNTVQRAKIAQRMGVLRATIDASGTAAAAQRNAKKQGVGGRAAAGAGVVGVFLLKSKALLLALLANAKLLVLGLFKLPMLASALVFVGLGRSGPLTAILGITLCIYVHEMGHVAALKRYGVEPKAPMFIPGFGAITRFNHYPADVHEDARTGLAGPLWGFVASVVAVLVGWLGHWPVATAVGSLSATYNAFNLAPVWILDGVRGFRALSRFERFIVAGTGIVVGSVLHQWVPLTVGVAAAIRALPSGDEGPPEGDREILWLFVILIAALGLVATLPTAGALPKV
jgi:Zn-dependent protease